MSTKATALIIAAMVCVTILVATVIGASILHDDPPAPAPSSVNFCPPRLESC